MSTTDRSHTWREIESQPETWRATLQDFAGRRRALTEFVGKRPFDRVITVGCGSTHYLAQSAAMLLSRVARVPAVALPSSEVWLSPDALLPGSTLLVAISRSGETTETLRAVESFRAKHGGPVLAIGCYPESTLMQAADFSLLAPAAQEQSVAQTRSFTSMFLLAQALSALLAGDEFLMGSLAHLPKALTDVVQRLADIPSRLGGDLTLERFYFLGRGVLYGMASEAMLKMKEMTLSHSEAYYPLEFRHGPMSMINDRTLVLGLVSDTGKAEQVAVLKDMHRLGARILALVEDVSGMGELCAIGDLIELKSDLDEMARAPLYLPPLQHLACHRAVAKGFDPDHPHNLTAVVSL
jgi:glutamine---fructose-6-phosphate transaminase (isomerizing)